MAPGYADAELERVITDDDLVCGSSQKHFENKLPESMDVLVLSRTQIVISLFFH